MEKYLIWRFLKNNIKRYHQYCMDWISHLTDEQIMYFSEEKERLTRMGIYSE
jgi:hypothetical protein